MRISFEQMKRVGGAGLEVALGIILVAMLIAVWSPHSKARGSEAIGATKTKGKAAASRFEGLLPLNGTPPAFDICIVDDSNRNQFQFSSTTGAYLFTNCAGFTTLTGTGILNKQGSTHSLIDNKTDRRVEVFIDLSVKKARASVQTFSPRRLFTIGDRNTANDTCNCGGPPV